MKLICSIFFCILLAGPCFSQSFNAALKTQMDSIAERDQRYRAALAELSIMTEQRKDSFAAALNCSKWRLERCLWQLQEDLDTNNQAMVIQIISKYGYPGKTLVGEPANKAAWLVLQHSRDIKQYYPMIADAASKGELPMYLAAMMEDRLLTDERQPQKYGTQAHSLNYYDSASKKIKSKMVIWPVADAANVNKRRKEAGFEQTVEANAQRLHATYDPSLTVEQMLAPEILPADPLPLPPQLQARIKKADALALPETDIDTFSFARYRMADSLGSAGDSVAASKHLVQVDPYYLLYISPSPDRFGDFIAMRQLTTAAKQRVTAAYDKVAAAPKSPAYDSFKHFYITGKYLAYVVYVSRNVDTDSIQQLLHTNDSLGAAYLQAYIKKKGWPTLAEGSMYAAWLAQRDIAHYYDYLPAAATAFRKGSLSLEQLRAIKKNRAYLTGYLYKKELKPTHRMFNISILTKGVLPSKAQKDSIMTLLQQKCPVKKVFFIYYSRTHPADFGKDVWWLKYGDKFQEEFLYFRDDLENACPSLDITSSLGPRQWYWLPSDKKEDEIYMYVCY